MAILGTAARSLGRNFGPEFVKGAGGELIGTVINNGESPPTAQGGKPSLGGLSGSQAMKYLISFLPGGTTSVKPAFPTTMSLPANIQTAPAGSSPVSDGGDWSTAMKVAGLIVVGIVVTTGAYMYFSKAKSEDAKDDTSSMGETAGNLAANPQQAAAARAQLFARMDAAGIPKKQQGDLISAAVAEVRTKTGIIDSIPANPFAMGMAASAMKQ